MLRREWSRLNGETDEEYATFHEWLHSVGFDGGQRCPPIDWSDRFFGEPKYENIYKWALNNHWQERARCYDDFVGKRQIIKCFPVCAPAGVLMAKIATVELERLRASQQETEYAGTVDIRHIRGWLRLVFDVEKETRKWEKITSISPEGEAYDWIRLDVEELRALEKLHAKAKIST